MCAFPFTKSEWESRRGFQDYLYLAQKYVCKGTLKLKRGAENDEQEIIALTAMALECFRASLGKIKFNCSTGHTYSSFEKWYGNYDWYKRIMRYEPIVQLLLDNYGITGIPMEAISGLLDAVDTGIKFVAGESGLIRPLPTLLAYDVFVQADAEIVYKRQKGKKRHGIVRCC